MDVTIRRDMDGTRGTRRRDAARSKDAGACPAGGLPAETGERAEAGERAKAGERADRGPAAGRSLAAASVLAGLALLAGCGGDGPTNGGNGTVESLDLEVGEIAVREAGDEVLALELPAGSEGRVYDVAAQVESRTTGVTSMRLRVDPGSGASGSVVPSAGRSPALQPPRSLERWTQARDLAVRMEIQENAKRLLRERNVRPARPGSRTAGDDGDAPGPRFASMLPSDSVPQEGDRYEFWYPVQDDFTIECETDSAEVITADVMAVGDRAVMMQDTTVDDGLLQNPMNYDSLAQAFDEEIFGTDVAYFGETTDIDGNGRTYVLFTTKVNGLTEDEDEGIVTGFFLASDLANSGDAAKDGTTDEFCEASNEAEVLYLLAPDPNGDHGPQVEVSRAKRSAGGTSAHEFQHLLNAGNRMIKGSGDFGDLEDTWLDEGLSHVAEEVVGLGLTGDPIRSNLTIADVTEDSAEVDAFNTFHLPNFARLAEYMRGPDTTRVLATDDPQGLESLRMRGFGWAFVRWLADQEATAGAGPVPGSGEETLIRQLARADGGLETGVQNVETTTGRTWSVLLEDFGLMPAVDDTVAGVDPRATLPTWDLRNVYLGLHENPGTDESFPEEYPLDVTVNAFAADTLDFEVQGGTQKYVRFDGSGASGSIVIRLSNQAGSALGATSGARLLIVRTR